MKKVLYSVSALILSVIAVSCVEEAGTVPGNDATPSVILFQNEPAAPYNPENDVQIRFATNSAAESVYYLVEKADVVESKLAAGEESFKNYVVSSGTKLDGVSGAANKDMTLTGLFGKYVIAAVAVKGNEKSLFTSEFEGLEWFDVVSGTYTFTVVSALAGDVRTTLQKASVENLYRFKDLFGEGKHLKIDILPGYNGKDADGEYRFFRVKPQDTGLQHSSGPVQVRDIGYWQNNSAFVTDNGYESGMYSDYNCFIYVQYFCPAGSFGYKYEFFTPDN